jgi:hypothetical protein
MNVRPALSRIEMQCKGKSLFGTDRPVPFKCGYLGIGP